jgi:HEAT repeat protein
LYSGDSGTKVVNPVTPVDVLPSKPAVSPEVQRLVEDLKAEYKTSLAAREALAKIGPSTIDAILPLLRDQDYYVRHAAADTLQRLNYQPATAEERAFYIVGLGNYMKGLDDENYNALVAGGSASVDALIGYLKDPSWMKPSETETMEVLVAIGKPAVPKLIQALNDPVARQDAGIVLLLIGDSQGKQAVTNLMYPQGISLSYYTANYKQILSNYDPYDTTSTDLLWLSLALETNGTKEMAEYFVNAGWPLHLIGEHWATAHGYVVRIKGWGF